MNIKMFQNRNAFSLIELILVIVILGIVGSIGSSIISDVFKNYILQRATQRASLKTELAAQQIANFLSYRIPHTTLARNPNDLTDSILVTEVDPSLGGDEDNIHTVLEWIGADNDSFTASRIPGWNGFCDIGDSNQTTIKTPGSNLNLARNIIKNLSNNRINLFNTTAPNVAIFFRDVRYTKNPDSFYDAKSCMGMTPGSDTSCISTVQRVPTGTNAYKKQTLKFVNGSATQKVLVEHYKLAWTAYAIVPFRHNSNTPCARGESHCDLKLFYNYQPWDGDTLVLGANSNIPHATIITNVTVFKFAELGSTLRFKLCAQENIGGDYNVTICKEKAIIL